MPNKKEIVDQVGLLAIAADRVLDRFGNPRRTEWKDLNDCLLEMLACIEDQCIAKRVARTCNEFTGKVIVKTCGP